MLYTEAQSRKGVLLQAFSHLSVDFYQGAIAAIVPFLVLERGWTYSEAASIVLTSSLASSIMQPIFGVLGDKWRMRWLIPLSILCGGLGVAAISLSTSQPFAMVVAALSGAGVAGFHPTSANRAREIAGSNTVFMSWYALGGNIGFAIAPLVVAATVGVWGLAASPALIVPALLGVFGNGLADRICPVPQGTVGAGMAKSGTDDWRNFLSLGAVVSLRSICFVGISSFIVLFMHEYRGVGDRLANLSLFALYVGGAFGTAIGGNLAKRWGRVAIMRASYLASVPAVAALFLVPGPAAWIFILVVSITLYVPFSLQMTLGQDYLPEHMGTASGVTLGLAVSIGGLASPLVGKAGEAWGLDMALLPLIAMPALAALVLMFMTEPRREQPQPAA